MECAKETKRSWPKASDFFFWWRFVDNLLAWTPTKFPATPLITGWYEAIFGYFLMVWFKMVPATNNTWVFKCSSCFGQKLQLILNFSIAFGPNLKRDHSFKTSANFYDFWPLPPYHRHSSKMLMKGIFDPYVLWPLDHRHRGTPLPP